MLRTPYPELPNWSSGYHGNGVPVSRTAGRQVQCPSVAIEQQESKPWSTTPLHESPQGILARQGVIKSAFSVSTPNVKVLMVN
ncbi:aldehyde dehydrogenase nad+ [Lasius niger]|uniref:Aldehyde dehydrogenase nad n=1 Tax=Lasius niger TaxID=67767 RepID=A0A0J7JU01_LASNI|nr:aldehyde dehydrogenase nad+ [Lasius niger]